MLAEAIAQMPAPRRKRLATRGKALAAKAASLDPRQYWSAKIPCAALAEDGRCLLHAARPLPCRGFNSADAGICRRSLAGEAARIPVLAVQFTLYGQAQAGLAQALASAGIDPGPLRLVDVLAAISPRR